MINLLPPEQADAIRYGRQNAILSRWLIGMAVATLGLVLVLFSGWIYLDQQAKGLHKEINVTDQQLQSQNLDKVQADAKEITGDIRVINQVLGTEIRFSDLIQAIGQDMPSGTVLGSLSLSNISGALSLSANAKDYNSAAQIAANLSNSQNGLFSKVDIINVNCKTNSSDQYPCSTSLRTLFSAAAKTKFLSIPKEDHS